MTQAMRQEFTPRMKAGPLRNGAERGHGRIWHAVEGDPYSGRAAICGEQPRIMWSDWQPPNATVTCPRCLRKLAKAEGREP